VQGPPLAECRGLRGLERLPTPGQTNAPTGVSAKSTEELVRQLSSDIYKEREAAQKELLHRGADAAKALKDALRAGSLDEEGVHRAGEILAKIDVPGCGAVWRDKPKAPRPEGLQDGEGCPGAPCSAAPSWRRAEGLTANS
jgi:hypothetical protein